ncbi:chemotaxis protein CheA [Paenibacillus sp. CAU 1782]
MSDYAEFRDIFLEELGEQIDEMEEELLRLEQQGATAEGIQRLFRVAHTIKGSSAAMGYEELKDLTHEWEHLLDMLRRKEMGLSRELGHLFFECLDSIKVMQGAIIRNAALSPALHIAARLREYTTKPASVKHCHSGQPEWPEEAVSFINNYSRDGENLPWAEIVLADDCLMKMARISVIDLKLRGVCEVLWSEPKLESTEDEEPGGRIRWLLAPGTPLEQVASILESQFEVASSATGEISPDEDYGEFEALPIPSGETPCPTNESGDHTENHGSTAADKKQSNQTIRVKVERLEEVMNLLGELVIDQTRMKQASLSLKRQYGSSEALDGMGEITDHLSRLIGELQENVMKVRMLPIEQLLNRFPRMVRDLALTLGKDVDLVVEGGDTELDRTLIEEIGDPLIHLIRNAVDHGIELPEKRIAAGKPAKGIVKIRAAHEDNQVVIAISDDGGGIDPAALRRSAFAKGIISEEEAGMLDEFKSLRLIFQPGFSTATAVSDISGRGVGMDIVRTDIERLNGRIDIDTTLGKGTTFIIRLPLTLAITTGLLVKASDQRFVLPMSSVVEIVRVDLSDLQMIKGSPVLAIRNQLLPLVWLHDLFGYPRELKTGVKTPVVVIASAEQKMAVCVDELLGNQEVVIKSLGSYVGKVPCISGATILGNGKIALILETGGLFRKANGII